MRDAHVDLAVLAGGAGIDRVADAALHGQRLAGERGLVDHRHASLHRAVHADGHARADDDEVTLGKLAGGHADLGRALDALGGLGQGEQRVDELVLRAGLGVVLERLADVQQEHRAAGGDEVALHEGDAHGGGVEHRHVEAAVEKRAKTREQELAVGPHRPDGADGGRQEPAAHIVEAHELGDVHQQVVGARGEGAGAVLALGVHGSRVDEADPVERLLARALAGHVIGEGHRADARVDMGARHGVAALERQAQRLDVGRRHGARKLQAQAARNVIDDCVAHLARFPLRWPRDAARQVQTRARTLA